jgi:hypothetical protein
VRDFGPSCDLRLVPLSLLMSVIERCWLLCLRLLKVHTRMHSRHVPIRAGLTPFASCRAVDPFLKKEWYDVKAPSMFSTRQVGKTLITRTQGTKVRGHVGRLTLRFPALHCYVSFRQIPDALVSLNHPCPFCRTCLPPEIVHSCAQPRCYSPYGLARHQRGVYLLYRLRRMV